MKKNAAKAAEQAMRKNPKAFFITLIAVVLVVAIALCVLRFCFPEKWDEIFGIAPKVDGTLVIHFIDVGQGDCIYIQFPDGTDMLIDCGNDCNYQDDVKAYIDALDGDGRIDRVMLTHGDEDHVDHLDEVLKDYAVSDIYMPNILAAPKNEKLKEQVDDLSSKKLSMFTDDDTLDTATYANFFIAALSEPNCNIHLNMDDDDFTNNIVIEGEGYTFTFYCPTRDYYAQKGLSSAELKNAVSPIGILAYNDRRIVFTGDSNKLNEPLFADRVGYIDCDVLKVGHHGSETSSTDEFLDVVNCEYAVISCNPEGNTYHHPRQAALDRMQERGMTVYRTDNDGTIKLTIDKNGDMTFSPSSPSSKNFVGAA